MANRNKAAGTKWERDIINDTAPIFSLIKFNNKNEKEAEIGRAAAFSRTLDNSGVDIWMKKQLFYIQAKSMTTKPNYYDLLYNKMPDDKIRIVCHRYTEKKKVKFVTKGEYAIMSKLDFNILIKTLTFDEYCNLFNFTGESDSFQKLKYHEILINNNKVIIMHNHLDKNKKSLKQSTVIITYQNFLKILEYARENIEGGLL